MKIQPERDIVQLKLDEVSAGALDTSSRDSAVEYGEVIAVGAGTTLKVGDKVFVKSWGIDLVNHEGKKFYFVNIGTNAILAKVE